MMNCRKLVLTFLFAGAVFGCQDDGGPRGHKSPTSARVEGARSEMQAALVILDEKSIARLGITIDSIKESTRPLFRQFGADVFLPPDGRVSIVSPFAARVLEVEKGSWPAVGQTLKTGHPLFRLEPLLSPERGEMTPSEQLDSDTKALQIRLRKSEVARDQATAAARLEAASAELKRSHDLFAREIDSQKRVDAATAAVAIARAEIKAAVALAAELSRPNQELKQQQPELTQVLAPTSGMVETVLIRPNQLVPAGAQLLTVMDMGSLWLDVSIYAGDVQGLDSKSEILVSSLGNSVGESSWRAFPIEFPIAGQPGTAAIRRVYRLVGKAPFPALGERVTVAIPLKLEGSALVVPRSAVVFDQSGHAWVYSQITPGKYMRKQVLVGRRDGEHLRLLEGPAPGTKIVISGVAELFGTEFGTGK